MGCLGECWDVGPPPDSILNLPPPPIPSFLQHPLPDLLLNTTPCSATQLCESFLSSNRVPEVGGDYVELPRKDIETWSMSGIDDTWLLVLVASSIGVLLLGALLAMFLLKCREMSMFEGNDCSIHTRDHRQIKTHEPRECTSVTGLNGNKLVHPSESVLYHGGPAHHIQDNRMVWAALTPHGTQHFVSENYPRDLVDYGDVDDHYETVDNFNIQPVLTAPTNHHPHPPAYGTCHKGLTLRVACHKNHTSFDNSGFVDYYDYEEPTPLIESYQLNDMMMMEHDGGNAGGSMNRELNNGQIQYHLLSGNTDMRCAMMNMGGFNGSTTTLRRGLNVRPRVSSPTRIEHPNLPPLNLYPHTKGTSTLKRNVLSYKSVENGTLPKYTS